MDEQKDNKTIPRDNNIDSILKFIHERPACHLKTN